MKKLPFYIITSDATSYILPATCYLYNKYWNIDGDQEFKVLGNHSPAQALPENFKFIKIKNENNIQLWTKYIYDYIKNNETSDYFILTLDDYLPNRQVDFQVLEQLVAYAKSGPKVGRISLGTPFVEKHDEVKSAGNSFYRLLQQTIYRISCQTSVWNREYFLKYFNHDWTPWQLELVGSKLAKNDGWEIIGSKDRLAFDWIEESALSGRWPGMINILGLKPEDTKYFIEHNIFNPSHLQYGIWYECRIPFISRFQSISKRLTKIPKFLEIGYKFNWKMIKPYVRSRTFKRLSSHYKDIY